MCKHNTIRVYVEQTYEGTLKRGVVHYDAAEMPAHTEVTQAVCLDCDKVFEKVDDNC